MTPPTTLWVPPTPGHLSLTLRPLTMADATAIRPMLEAPDVRAGMLWDDEQCRDAERWLEDVLQEEQRRPRLAYTFGVVPDASNVVAGIVRVAIHPFSTLLQVDLSAFLAAEQRGHGYARRALQRVRDWCFEELTVVFPAGERFPIGEVTAICLPDNTASRAILEHHLLTPYGERPAFHTSGEIVNALAFGLTRAEHMRQRDFPADSTRDSPGAT